MWQATDVVVLVECEFDRGSTSLRTWFTEDGHVWWLQFE